LSTEIHIAVDALGHPLRLILTAGQVHEATQALALIAGPTLVGLIAGQHARWQPGGTGIPMQDVEDRQAEKQRIPVVRSHKRKAASRRATLQLLIGASSCMLRSSVA
jgi:hypothetical protein